MKQVLYVVSTLKRTGPTNQLSYIIKYLDRSKYTPIILTLSPEPDTNSMESYFVEKLNVKIKTLGLSRIQGLFFAKKKIEEFIKNYNIDIVHSQGIRADGLINNINIPKVSTLRNYPYYDYPMKFGKVKGMFMARNHLKTIKNESNKNIACSKTIAKEFEQNKLKLNYIQNGVDTEKFFPLSEKDRKELRIKLNIQQDKQVFVSVGSLIPRKDMSTVIKSFVNLGDEDKLLLIIGDGVDRQELESLANNKVMFLGNISNVSEYLQISDCFVSGSLAEGLPNTVLEAMACGLPTILSNIPSHLELYENEKSTFFKVKDSDFLTSLLRQENQNLANRKKLSLKLVKENFSAKAMSEKYQKVYKEKLNGRL